MRVSACSAVSAPKHPGIDRQRRGFYQAAVMTADARKSPRASGKRRPAATSSGGPYKQEVAVLSPAPPIK